MGFGRGEERETLGNVRLARTNVYFAPHLGGRYTETAMSLPRPIPDPPPTILVVDDVATVLKATARMLELEGYRVLTARDGIEALEVLERTPVHAVLSDLRMPRMDGDALAAEVAAHWP